MSYEPTDFSIIAATAEYSALQSASIQRDRHAATIMLHPKRYSKALEIYGLDLQTLTTQANTHHLRQTVKRYQDFIRVGNARFCNSTAYELMRAIKTHYRFLKAANVDMALLRQHAAAHQKRLLFKTLTVEEQDAFDLVARYQQLSQQMGKAFEAQQSIAREPEAIYSREVMQTTAVVSCKREALAAHILAQREVCGAALTFYQIGEAKPLFEGVVTTEMMKAAEAKWYKLQQAASRHRISDIVQQYHSALLQGDQQQRELLAHHIIEDPKAYHGAVVNTAGVPAALWRAIRKDAKGYARHQLYECLTPEQGTHFEWVEAFVTERRHSGEIWAEILASKSVIALSDTEFQDKLLPFANATTEARDRLALAITLNPEPYQVGLTFYDVKPEHLDKAAYAQRCRQAVAFYRAETDVVTRSRIAQTIASDPKAHHGAVLAAGVSWRDVHRQAQVAERIDQFAEFAGDEKRLWRLAARYKCANIQAGRAWSLLLGDNKSRGSQIALNKRQQAATTLSAKRDYLAAQLVSQRDFMHWHHIVQGQAYDFSALDKSLRLNGEKIKVNAQRHAQRLEQVTAWQQAQVPMTEMLPQLLSGKTLNRDTYLNWQDLEDHTAGATKAIEKQLPSYLFALHSAGTSLQAFKKLATTKQLLRASLQSLEAQQSFPDTNTQNKDTERRIKRAREIEQGTRPIQGTLAERYLREHRGILGELPESLRFHPGLYHWESQRKLPALVAIAKNELDHTQAVQAIFLDAKTANKAQLASPKLTYGVLSQRKVGVLINAGQHTPTIAIAEGVETALSIREADPNLRVYAILGSSNFARAPMADDTQKVLFCADNDGKNSASQKKLQQAAEKIARQGIEVRQTQPIREKQDFNDVLRQRGKSAVQEQLQQVTLITKGQRPDQLIKQIEKDIETLIHHPTKIVAIKSTDIEQPASEKNLGFENHIQANTQEVSSMQLSVCDAKEPATQQEYLTADWSLLKELPYKPIKQLIQSKENLDTATTEKEKQLYQQHYQKSLATVVESSLLRGKIKEQSSKMHDYLLQQHRQGLTQQYGNWHDPVLAKEWEALSRIESTPVQNLVRHYKRSIESLSPKELNQYYVEFNRRLRRITQSRLLIKKLESSIPMLIKKFNEHKQSLAKEHTLAEC